MNMEVLRQKISNINKHIAYYKREIGLFQQSPGIDFLEERFSIKTIWE